MTGEPIDQPGYRCLGYGHPTALPGLGLGLGLVEHHGLADAADHCVQGGAPGGARTVIEGVTECEYLGVSASEKGWGDAERGPERVDRHTTPPLDAACHAHEALLAPINLA